MKKTIWTVIVVVLVAIALGYIYFARPSSAPTESNTTATSTVSTPVGGTLYRISAGSNAEFYINELLFNKPKLVVGTTTEITGDIALSDTKVDMGEIRINARTWKTDSSARNGSIDRLILRAEDPANEFIVFKPLSNDFKGRVSEGKDLTFNVSGDLTISGVTKPATFKVTAKISGDTLSGTAETTIKRSDYNLVIPSLSFIANVDEQIPVKANIVAARVR